MLGHWKINQSTFEPLQPASSWTVISGILIEPPNLPVFKLKYHFILRTDIIKWRYLFWTIYLHWALGLKFDKLSPRAQRYKVCSPGTPSKIYA